MRMGWVARALAVVAVLAGAVSCSSGEPEVVAPAAQITPTLISTPEPTTATEEPPGPLSACGSNDVPEGGATVSESRAIEIAFGNRDDLTCDDLATRYYWIKNRPRWRVVITSGTPKSCEETARVDAVTGELINRTKGC